MSGKLFDDADAGEVIGSMGQAGANKSKESAEEHRSHCPYCNRRIKTYRRGIHDTMAIGLIALYKADKKEPDMVFHHINDIYKNHRYLVAGDFSKLRWWGLIEAEAHNPEDKTKTDSGCWRITEHGKRFVERQVKVQAKALVRLNKFQGYEEGMVDIIECLKKRFTYWEIMGLEPPKS